MAEADDLVGTIALSVPQVVPDEELVVTLTVTNVSDHRIALEYRAGKPVYLAARLVVVGNEPVFGGYVWLGDRELDPGETYTMSRPVPPIFSFGVDAEVEVVAVIAASLDSFNRAQNTLAIVPGVPAIIVPVAGAV